MVHDDAGGVALDLLAFPVTAKQVRRVQFDLAYQHDGFGVSLCPSVTDDWEWPKLSWWHRELADRLQADQDAIDAAIENARQR